MRGSFPCSGPTPTPPGVRFCATTIHSSCTRYPKRKEKTKEEQESKPVLGQKEKSPNHTTTCARHGLCRQCCDVMVVGISTAMQRRAIQGKHTHTHMINENTRKIHRTCCLEVLLVVVLVRVQVLCKHQQREQQNTIHRQKPQCVEAKKSQRKDKSAIKKRRGRRKEEGENEHAHEP